MFTAYDNEVGSNIFGSIFGTVQKHFLLAWRHCQSRRDDKSAAQVLVEVYFTGSTVI